MKISQKGIDLIKELEGFRSKPYICSSGVATIGFGSTFYESGRKVTLEDKAITEKEAEKLLLNTLETFEHALSKLVTSNLNQNQIDALLSFMYNVGIGGFKNSTLLKRVNANPQDNDIYYQFQRWCKVTKPGKKTLEVSEGLKNRRLKEARLYFS